MTIAFPELHRESMLELPVIGAISAIAGGLLVPWSWALAAVAFVPCGLWVLHSARVGVANACRRYRWSKQFARRLSWRQLRAEVRAEPSRFIVHIRYFGGFDVTPLRPVAVLEDLATGELSAVHPASWHVPSGCERLGVVLVRG